MIVNDGRTVVENSTISGNHANFADPGLGGGALFVGGAFPDVLLRFSTVAGNTAAGNGGGGGILGDEKVKLYGTLLQGNSGGDCAAGSHPTSLGYNIASDATCPLAQPSDLLSTDAMLGPLADNGGATPTQDVPMASPAVDRVPVEDCTVFADQRGVARPQHGACDVGAVEHVYTARDLMDVLLTQITGVGPGNSLAAKFAAALATFSDRHPRLACMTLNALRHEVQAQSGKKIPAAKAAAIVETVGELEDVIGC